MVLLADPRALVLSPDVEIYGGLNALTRTPTPDRRFPSRGVRHHNGCGDSRDGIGRGLPGTSPEASRITVSATLRRPRMLLPHTRGPLSKSFIEALRGDGDVASFFCPPPADALTDDDLQLTLWICYELHYRGFDEVDDSNTQRYQ